MKTVSISAQPARHFSRKYTGFFNQPVTGTLSLQTLLTQLACVCLAGCEPLSLHSRVGEGCPAKKMTSF